MSRRTGGWAARKQRPRFRPGGILSPTSQPGFHTSGSLLEQADFAKVTIRFARGDVLVFAAADLEVIEDQVGYDFTISTDGAIRPGPNHRRFTVSGQIVGSNR